MFYVSDMIEKRQRARARALATLQMSNPTRRVHDNTTKSASGFTRITGVYFCTGSIFSSLGKSGCDFRVIPVAGEKLTTRTVQMDGIGGAIRKSIGHGKLP